MGAVTQRGRTPIVHYPVQGDPYVTFWLKKVPLYLPPKKNRPASADPIPAPRQGRPILVVPHWVFVLRVRMRCGTRQKWRPPQERRSPCFETLVTSWRREQLPQQHQPLLPQSRTLLPVTGLQTTKFGQDFGSEKIRPDSAKIRVQDYVKFLEAGGAPILA
jgi:hypothetical protein